MLDWTDIVMSVFYARSNFCKTLHISDFSTFSKWMNLLDTVNLQEHLWGEFKQKTFSSQEISAIKEHQRNVAGWEEYDSNNKRGRGGNEGRRERKKEMVREEILGTKPP